MRFGDTGQLTMEEAAKKRDSARGEVNSWIQKARSLIADKEVESALNGALSELNEAMSVFASAQLDYTSAYVTEDAPKQDEKTRYEEVENDVRMVSEDIGNYL